MFVHFHNQKNDQSTPGAFWEKKKKNLLHVKVQEQIVLIILRMLCIAWGDRSTILIKLIFNCSEYSSDKIFFYILAFC